MKRKRPMLVITLQIPLTPDLSAEDVLDALREQTETALQMVREQMAQDGYEEDGDEDQAVEMVRPTVAMAGLETLEPFSDETKENMLDRLGYRDAE
jgi:hypothetical protein